MPQNRLQSFAGDGPGRLIIQSPARSPLQWCGKLSFALVHLAFYLVRLVLFWGLCWLRFPIHLVCNAVASLAFIAFLIAWIAWPAKHDMVWGEAGLSFVAFMAGMAYDFVLMAVDPEEYHWRW